MEPMALGRYLRESREAKELTIEDAVRTLRIRRHVLESFEMGDFRVAETPVQVRGLLRNYARYLGLDEERVLQFYEAALVYHERKGRKKRGKRDTQPTQPVAPRRITDTPPSLPVVNVPLPLGEQRRERRERRSSWLSRILLALVSVAAIVLIAFVATTLVNPVTGEQTPPPTLDATSQAAALTATATYTPSWTPRPSDAPPTPTSLASFLGIGVRINLNVLQRTYVRILVDGREEFAGIAEPGRVIAIEGSDQVAISASNAAGVELEIDGVTQGNFGVRGQALELLITRSGITTRLGSGGMATSTPEPAVTLLPSPTPFILEPASPTPEVGLPPLATSEGTPDFFVPPATPAPDASPTPLFPQAPAGSGDQDFNATPLAPAVNTLEVPPAASPTAALSPTPQPPAASATPTITVQPSATAILPPRLTPTGQPPAKPPAP